jgi:hypothetical protein
VTGANVTSPTGGERVTQESCWCTGIHRHESAGVRGSRSLAWVPRLPSGRFSWAASGEQVPELLERFDPEVRIDMSRSSESTRSGSSTLATA